MEFKGTQGEWKAVTLEATDFYLKRSEVHYGDDGECVAEYIGCPIDAQLIAAAPELLAALQSLLKLTKTLHHPSIDFANGTARNAINKSLGL